MQFDDLFGRVFFCTSRPFVEERLATSLFEPLQHLLVELDFLYVELVYAGWSPVNKGPIKGCIHLLIYLNN